MKKIALYTVPTSIYYPMAKEFFSENNIPFDTFLKQNETEIEKETGQKGKLQFVIYDTNEKGDVIDPQIMVDFDKDKISEILGIKTND